MGSDWERKGKANLNRVEREGMPVEAIAQQ